MLVKGDTYDWLLSLQGHHYFDIDYVREVVVTFLYAECIVFRITYTELCKMQNQNIDDSWQYISPQMVKWMINSSDITLVRVPTQHNDAYFMSNQAKYSDQK